MIETHGAQPPSAADDIQFTPEPWRGQECPHHGLPVGIELVQSLQVDSALPYSMPCSFVPVSTWWLSGQALPVQPGAPSVWFGTPFSFGRSLMISGSAPRGRGCKRSALFAATSRPSRSYHGPSPTRSFACTGPAVELRNARHTLLPAPGSALSAMRRQ